MSELESDQDDIHDPMSENIDGLLCSNKYRGNLCSTNVLFSKDIKVKSPRKRLVLVSLYIGYFSESLCASLIFYDAIGKGS